MLPEAIEAAHLLLDRRDLRARRQLPYRQAARRRRASQDAFARFKLVATIEEHSLIGGFGSAVAEWLDRSRGTRAQKFIRFGTPDAFFKKSGEQEFAREELGLTGHQIADRIANTLG